MGGDGWVLPTATLYVVWPLEAPSVIHGFQEQSNLSIEQALAAVLLTCPPPGCSPVAGAEWGATAGGTEALGPRLAVPR